MPRTINAIAADQAVEALTAVGFVVVADHPTMVCLADTREATPTLPVGWTIALPVRDGYHLFTVGTLRAFFEKYHSHRDTAEQIDADVAQALAEGQDAAWLTPEATVLSTGPIQKRVVIAYAWGQEVVVDGARYQIRWAANDNAKLAPVS